MGDNLMKSPSSSLLAATLLCVGAQVAAQEAVLPQLIDETAIPEMIENRIEDPSVLMAAPMQLPLSGGDTLMFTQLELAGPTEVVLGKPYSAELTVTTHQPLLDGNTITVERHSRVYRDEEGRTRRDDELGTPDAQQIFISDPVAGTSYMLDPVRRLADQFPSSPHVGAAPTSMSAQNPATPDTTFDVSSATLVSGRPALASPTPSSTTPQFTPGIPIKLPFPGEPEVVNLGTRVIEGLDTTGTRSVVIIPAGAIGNRAPIEIVTEQWFSPELNLVLLSEHRDPRVGETTFRLQQIRRTSPDPKLFSIPADYTISVPK
jgi:hypothetical protein